MLWIDLSTIKHNKREEASTLDEGKRGAYRYVLGSEVAEIISTYCMGGREVGMLGLSEERMGGVQLGRAEHRRMYRYPFPLGTLPPKQ